MHFKINNYYLDSEQERIVLDSSKHLLVVAGAGSGKTLTILGKIKYLIYEKNIQCNEILCISFTKKAASSLKEKIKKEFNTDIDVYTFHKLGLEILKENNKMLEIADSNLLDDIINRFFQVEIFNYPKLMKLAVKYFQKKLTYEELLTLKQKEIAILSKTISTFLHLFKCNGYNIQDFTYFFKQIKFTLSYKKYKSESIFLLLTFNIYLLYNSYLKENNEIDFDDMLIESTNYIKKYNYPHKLKYIIIDEYQDTSMIRFNLVKELLNKTGANLMVVGDDFQSIYGFAGCNLSLFIDFNKYFQDSKILKIENTYRNSQELINVAGSFVMKNKKQIRKKLKSKKTVSNPIVIIYYHNLNQTLNNLVKKLDNDLMILGRNNNDINLLPNHLKDKFLTVHKSKGLEAENVIIINLKDDILGFPNQIKEENIFRFVSPKLDKFPYSEERRLFYVALTRTKNKVYLLVNKKNSSIFIKELIRNYKRYIKIYNK